MNNLFINEFLKVKKERDDLFLCDSDQVCELYNIGRSLRRGSQIWVREEGVPTSAIDLVNRWRKVELHGDIKPGGAMRDHYTEIRLIQKRLLVYSLFL